ncbi:MAG TPA: hypothetical protein VJ044_17700, partial [Candidatus Hodarchaeales archaeon]|nr:hypothetical protein [Candidatus Hodarchaeales archaeon]
WFEGKLQKPAGIISTTLAAYAYHNQPDLFDALSTILQEGPKFIRLEDGDVVISNPINQSENFADKMKDKPSAYREFLAWNSNFSGQLERLGRTPSLADAEPLLMEMFGERIAKESLKESQSSGNQRISIPGTPYVRIEGNPKPWRP